VCTDVAAGLAFYRDGISLREIEGQGAAVRLFLGTATLLLLTAVMMTTTSGPALPVWPKSRLMLVRHAGHGGPSPAISHRSMGLVRI
jgi:hypothetical protein